MDIRPVWYRWPRETTQAYAAFCLYRDMGVTRTIRKVSEEGIGALKRMERWSKKWKWVARTQAYDEHLEKERTIIFHEERRLAIARQAKLGAKMRDKAEAGLDVLSPDQLAAAEICRLAETGVKIERLAYGDSTDNQTGAIHGQFTMTSLPPWAAQQVKALDESSAGASRPADPTERSLKASTILELEEATSG